MRNHSIVIDITCELNQEYFGVWKDLTDERRTMFEDFPTHCDGGGVMGEWCRNCKFCYTYEES